MASQYHSLFTTQGLELLREAIQNGTKLGITHMSYGDGNGSLPVPDAAYTQMINEVYRTQLNRLAPSKENANWLEADGIIPSAVGGFNIREVALWAGNVMVAYANYPPTYKPTADQGTAQIKTIRIVLQIDNTANFDLVINPDVVFATKRDLEEFEVLPHNIQITQHQDLESKVSESLSVLDYGAKQNLTPADSFDSTQAFKNALDFDWVCFPAASSLSYFPQSKNRRVRVPLGRYLITDTLPTSSYLHLDFDDGVVLEFKPSTPKPMFYPAVDKAKAAYQAGNTNWKSMTIYGLRMTGSATLLGNMTATSTDHASCGIYLGNPFQNNIERLSIEGFKVGIQLDRLTANEIGAQIGNFYHNVLNNVVIKDCTTCLINNTNLLTVLNGHFGIEKFYNTSPNMGDYLIINRGAGATFVGTDIASMGYTNNPKKALIYDKCDGSVYQSIYAEKFNTLIEVDPVYRYGGLNFDMSHIYKTPENTLLKFIDGFMPNYDPIKKIRTGVNIKGTNSWSELPTLGIKFGNSSTELLSDYFELAPQLDFKYGLYGTSLNWAQQIAVDFKRYELNSTGFLSKYGARFIAMQKSALYVPIKNSQYDSFICVLAKVIAGTFNQSNIKINVGAGGDNSYIATSDVYYDYGNGWKMYAVRDCKLDPKLKSNFQIEFSAGDQVEIEHIGAYKNGVPIYPTNLDFKPRVNSTNFMYNQQTTNETYRSKYSGGQFALGDQLDPFIPVIDGVLIQSEPILMQYVSKEGSNRQNIMDGNHAAYYGSASVNFIDTNIFESTATTAGNSRNFAESVGVGQYIGVTKDTVTKSDVKVVERIYDISQNKYSTQLKVNQNIGIGTAQVDHLTAQKPIYSVIKEQNLLYKSSFANITNSTATDLTSVNSKLNELISLLKN